MKIRKIISKTEEDKKRKKNQLMIGGILILVMVLSVLGYSFEGNDENENEKIVYNSFKFIKQNGIWILNTENFQFSFKYNPKEVKAITEGLNLLDSYLGKPLYIYSENSEAEGEIYKNLFYYNQIVERAQEACPENEECEADLPVKTCADNLVIIKKSEETIIKQEGNCVFIEGKEEDLMKLTDSFLFKIIGIQ